MGKEERKMDETVVLAVNLRGIRAELHLTQEKLANKSGITLHCYNSLECCRSACRLDTLGSIAAALGMEISELMDSDRFPSDHYIAFQKSLKR